jgi:hypothetical protein
MIHAIFRDSLTLSHSRKNLGTLKVDRKSVDMILGNEVHSMRLCISCITGIEAEGDMMVVHLARSIRLTYAGAVNLVERKSTPYPSLFRAKKVMMASRQDGVRRAIIGACSKFGSCNGQRRFIVYYCARH